MFILLLTLMYDKLNYSCFSLN